MVLGHDIHNSNRTQDVKISQNVSFETMLLADETLKGLRKSGFSKPSPIQLRGIPLGKCGFDLLLEAKSGTGKTAVFTVIALEKLNLSKGVQIVILAPTREIASQICDVISTIGAYYKGLNVVVVMGGIPVKEDIDKFKENVHIVVGSPGRLRHLLQDKHIDVSSVRLLVLDEADKLMEPAFLPDINSIFSLLPKQKQVIMSSATYMEETKTFIEKYVKKAQHVCPDSSSVLLGIDQKVIIVPYNSNISKQTSYRYEELKKILSRQQFKQCLVFCNYQVRVTHIHRLLTQDNWPCEQLYGLQEQRQRLGALKTLQEYKCRILVSTDLAARGIDASNIDLVINFEPPYEWQTYLHRIGRAGRYGSYGIAITILCKGAETTKFQETLANTNISFNIRHFGSDEPFVMNAIKNAENGNSEPPANISTSIDNNINNFTIDLGEKNEIKEEILGFEELCDSFQNSVIGNESMEEDEVQKLAYKHVKLNKVPLMKNKDSLSDKNKYLNQSSEDEEEKIIGSYSTKILNGSKTEITVSNNNNPVNGHVNKEQKNEFYLEETYNQNDSTFKKKSYETNTTIEHALLEAGLPTAFGKTMQSKKLRKKRFNKCNDDDNYNTNEHESSNSIVKDKSPMTQHGLNNEIKRKGRAQCRVDRRDNLSPESSIDKSDHSDHSLNNYDQQRDKNFKGIHKPACNLYNTDIQNINKRNKEFDNWYNQLRMQSQFIQYNLYIEELRKL